MYMKRKNMIIICMILCMLIISIVKSYQYISYTSKQTSIENSEENTDLNLQDIALANDASSKQQEDDTRDEKEELSIEKASDIFIEMDNAMQSLVKEIELQGENEITYEEIEHCITTYFDESLVDYVMFLYRICEENGEYIVDRNYERATYKINTNKEMILYPEKENIYQIGITFSYRWEREYVEEIVPICLEWRESKWLITNIDQWCNDFRYNYMPNEEFCPLSFSKEQADELVQLFCIDNKGNANALVVDVDKNGYILPDSSNRLLDVSEVNKLSRYEQYLAIHEIYARHGKKFKDTVLNYYFSRRSWYCPYNYVFSKEELSVVEEENIRLLTKQGSFVEEASIDYGNLYPISDMGNNIISAEEIAVIVTKAFAAMDRILVEKEENYQPEKSQDVFKYYTLGEYSTEESLKEYLAEWYSEEVFDYVVWIYSIANVLYQDENGNFGICLEGTPYASWHEIDHYKAIEIVYADEKECRVKVPFINNKVFYTDPPEISEGEILLRKESNKWIIADMSQSYYDSMIE